MTDTASWATTGGARVGPDRERRPYPTDSRFWISSARWLQRAINAWRAQRPGSGAAIEVDGRAGPVTMDAARAMGPIIPIENYPPGQRVTDQVLIARTFAAELESLPFVPDPVVHEDVAPVPTVAADVAMPTPSGSRVQPWIWMAGGLGVVLLLVLAGAYFFRGTSSSRSSRRALRGVELAPVPARGDPKGHIAASSLGGLRKRRSRKK